MGSSPSLLMIVHTIIELLNLFLKLNSTLLLNIWGSTQMDRLYLMMAFKVALFDLETFLISD